jgi:tripartite-type tricarboxylate transporter receptor subunit TctC
MTLDRRAALAGASAAAAALLLPGGARAQAPLSGIARVICGFPAGGTVDSTARRLAEHWRGKLAETVIVENRVGAGGRTAIMAVKDAAPDGRTVLVSPSSMMTIYPSVYRRLGYEPASDIAPVSTVCVYTFALGVGPMVPANVTTLAQFLHWSKANPQVAAFASPAAGSAPHFMGEMLFRNARIEAKHVPYRGSAPAIQDLVGGHIPACITVLGEFLPFMATPGIRMLAVADGKRSRFMPQVPTFAEAGHPAISGLENYGVYLPGRAPAALAERLAALTREAIADRQTAEGLEKIGMDAVASAPPAFVAQIAAERQAWAPIVKDSGFSLEE